MIEMIWGDKKIYKKMYMAGAIEHTKEEMINPASINLRLGNSFAIPAKMLDGITLGERLPYGRRYIGDDEKYPLKPGEFILATTKEYIYMPVNVAAFVQGRSSIGRIGLTVQNAGFIDPGFNGSITLELVNESPSTIFLVPGYPVAQLVFFDCTKVKNPYHGKYNGQRDATESRMEEDLKKYPGLSI